MKRGANLNKVFIACKRSVHQFVLDLRSRCYCQGWEWGLGKGFTPPSLSFKFNEFEAKIPGK
jgi:hypothetical protein